MVKENEKNLKKISACSIIVASRVKVILFKRYGAKKYVLKIRKIMYFSMKLVTNSTRRKDFGISDTFT